MRLFLFVPTFLSFKFLTKLYYYYSYVCPFLLHHFCCSHARGILCGIHTPCMGSPLPAGYTRWSLEFRGEIVVISEALLFRSTDWIDQQNNNNHSVLTSYLNPSCIGYVVISLNKVHIHKYFISIAKYRYNAKNECLIIYAYQLRGFL